MSHIALHTVATVRKSLTSLVAILEKVPAFIVEKGLTEDKIIHSKLADDMLPFVKQIQIASDNAKGIVSRLSDTPNPSMLDDETTIAQLIERLKKTLEFMDSVPAEKYDGFENRRMILQFMPGKFVEALDYIVEFALPNFYFHYVTSYDILRNQGMNLGKSDYIGSVSFKDLES